MMFYDNICLKRKNNLKYPCTVSVPYSKSISNRLLVIKYLADSRAEIRNLSDSDDTVMLNHFLQSAANKDNAPFFCKNAGTVLRFLLTTLALTPGRWTLDADKRMQNRPLLPLIDILKTLGADITVSNNENIFPITINGRKLSSNNPVILQENLTSQFISALLLISPYIENGITIIMPPNQLSLPYINMTASLVNQFGGDITKTDNTLVCRQSEYKFNTTTVERDFSAAAFIYAFVAAGKLRNIQINNLQTSLLQGDFECVNLFGALGVKTIFNSDGAVLSYDDCLASANQEYEFDLGDYPDLFCPLAVACFICGKKTLIKNLQSLRVKESDRLQNIVNELNKIEKRCEIQGDSLIIEPTCSQGINKTPLYSANHAKEFTKTPLYFDQTAEKDSVFFKTYNDHRIAMALSAFAFVYNGITIENPACTEKSFPDFWKQVSVFFDGKYI